MEFLGYEREDGRAGIRNKVLILPTSVCATDTARIVANSVEGAVTFHNQNGCSQVESDTKYTMDIMAGFAANPNVYGTVIISLGCEICQMDRVEQAILERTNKPLVKFVIQENGGTINTIAKATAAAQKMAQKASEQSRVPIDMSRLILGTECGGSDPTSGLIANPMIGEMCDRLVELGGTAILSETTEFIGGEHLLAKRAVNDVVKGKIYNIVDRYEKEFENIGENLREGNPSPGNKAGGLTTLEEKSLGCIHKSGTAPITEVIDYAQQIEDEKGLIIMDTPSNDSASVAGMAAGGAQVVIFSTGRGTPTGNPIVPVIKITGNKITYENMSDNLDFDVSRGLYDSSCKGELAQSLFDEILKIVNGKLTKSEVLGYYELSISRKCNYV